MRILPVSNVFQNYFVLPLLYWKNYRYFAYFVTRYSQLWMETLDLLYPCTIFPFFFSIQTILGIMHSILPACVKVIIRQAAGFVQYLERGTYRCKVRFFKFFKEEYLEIQPIKNKNKNENKQANKKTIRSGKTGLRKVDCNTLSLVMGERVSL